MTGGDFEVRQTHIFYRCKANQVILEELKVDSFQNNFPFASTVTKSTHLSGNKKREESKHFYFNDCATGNDHLTGQQPPNNECPFVFTGNTWYRVRHGNAHVATYFYVDSEGKKVASQ
jgi:hypothetical protein